MTVERKRTPPMYQRRFRIMMLIAVHVHREILIPPQRTGFAQSAPGGDFVSFAGSCSFWRRVLIINSYNQGYEWTDAQVEGILAALKTAAHEVYVEYLDNRRFGNSVLDSL